MGLFSSRLFLLSSKPMEILISAAGKYKIPAPIIPIAVLEPTIKDCISILLAFKLNNTTNPAKMPINRALPERKKSDKIPNNWPRMDNRMPIILESTIRFFIAYHPF